MDVQEDLDSSELLSSMSSTDRVALLNQLPAHLGTAARGAVDKVNGSDLQVLLATCHLRQKSSMFNRLVFGKDFPAKNHRQSF